MELEVLPGDVLDVFDDAGLESLGTQAGEGRRVAVVGEERAGVLRVRLREDAYTGFVRADRLKASAAPARAPPAHRPRASDARQAADAATDAALALARTCGGYLWGGAAKDGAAGLDCSGLVQVAFAVGAGWWVPRDAWMQENYCAAVSAADVRRGDLVFFGNGKRGATHVGFVVDVDDAASAGLASDSAPSVLYLHCSGYDIGRGGCGIDAYPSGAGTSMGRLGIGRPGWQRSEGQAADDDGGGGVGSRYAPLMRGFGRVGAPLDQPAHASAWNG